MSLENDLDKLLDADIIDANTAEKIRNYYQEDKGQSNNRLLVSFGILGALLVGLGIILIMAHNWDDLSRSSKTGLSFLPLVLGQLLCLFTLWKKPENISWREACSVFLFFAIGASIALISQVYNIPGNLASYLLTWTLLALPVIYLMRSSAVSMLYLIGITWYATETGYWSAGEAIYYWPLLLAALPYYLYLVRTKPGGNFTAFHHWVFPLSLIISLGTISQGYSLFMFLAYICLFALLYHAASLPSFRGKREENIAYRVFGALGTVVILLITSFNWFWEDLYEKTYPPELYVSYDFISCLVLLALATAALLRTQAGKKRNEISATGIMYLLFALCFLLGMVSHISVVIINLAVLALGLLSIREGAQKAHLGIMNYGLLVITALIACRFADTDLSFVVRGLIFITVGAGFFVANYRLLKKKKAHDK